VESVLPGVNHPFEVLTNVTNGLKKAPRGKTARREVSFQVAAL
jgi:hypothetical protein